MDVTVDEIRVIDWGGLDVTVPLPEDAYAKFAKMLEEAANQKGKIVGLYKSMRSFSEQIKSEELQHNYLFMMLKAVALLTTTTNRLTINGDEFRDVIYVFFTEARHYPTESLIKFAVDCLDHLTNSTESDNNSAWVEIFGRVICVLSTRGSIEFNGDVHTGKQFKSEVIWQIIRISWKSQNAPSLVACLREIGMEEASDVTQLLEKVSSSLESMDPNSIPPLTHQLLAVFGDAEQFSQFINILDDYFNKTTNKVQSGRKFKILGTVVYHFSHATKVMPPLRLEILRRVKTASPEMVTKRLSLGVSLCLTQFEDIRSSVVNGLKCAIARGCLDSALQKDTYWYQTSYETDVVDPIECFRAIFQSRSSELEFMLEGLKELAFGLVSMDEKDTIIKEKCKALASLILTRVLGISREELGIIALKLLRNQNVTSIECLADLIKTETRAMLDPSNMAKVYELVHQLPLLPLEMAVPLVRALLPAFELSHPLMGEALLIFRKSLWKSMEARRVSVATMILLLSKLQIKCAPPELTGQRDFMMDTQVTTNPGGHPTSESVTMNQLLCSEIVSIIGRFFSHGRLRDHLYIGLESVLMKNVDLIPDISGQLLLCLKYHMSSDSKTMVVASVFQSPQEEEPGQFNVMEELGLLFQAVCSMIRITGREFVSGDWPGQVLQCQKLVHNAGTDVLTYDLGKFETYAEGLRTPGDSTIETTRSVRNVVIVQWLQIIEALMEHVLRGGKLAHNLTITALNEKFQELQKLLKEIGISAQKKDKSTASKKSSKKDKKDDTSDNTTNTSSVKSGPKVKFEPSKKVVYIHIITLTSIQQALDSLYKDQENDSPLKPIQNTTFENYLFRVIEQKLEKLNHNETIQEFDHGRKFLVKVFLLIVRSLLDRIMKCVEKEGEGNSTTLWNDDEVVLLEAETGNSANNRRLELIVEILQFVDKQGEYRNRIMQFISLDKSLNYEADFQTFYGEYWFKLFQRFTAGDVNMTGLEHLMSILSVLLAQLLPSSKMADRVWDDLNNFAWDESMESDSSEEQSQEGPTVGLVENTIKCITVIRTKISRASDMLTDLAKYTRLKLGSNQESEEGTTPVKRSWLIIDDTAFGVVKALGLWAEKMLNLAALFVSRIQSQSSFSNPNSVCSAFDHCVSILNEVMHVLMELAGSSFPRGICGDIMLRVSTLFFTIVTNLAEEICNFVTSEAGRGKYNMSKFKALIKGIGRDFKRAVDGCVQYLELIEREEACEVEEKLKNDKKNKGKKVNMRIVRKFGKDTKTIPALVFSVEKYDVKILNLGKRAKTDLFVGTRLSNTRDFRIEMTAIRRAAVPPEPSVVDQPAANRTNRAEDNPAEVSTSRKRKHPARVEPGNDE